MAVVAPTVSVLFYMVILALVTLIFKGSFSGGFLQPIKSKTLRRSDFQYFKIVYSAEGASISSRSKSYSAEEFCQLI